MQADADDQVTPGQADPVERGSAQASSGGGLHAGLEHDDAPPASPRDTPKPASDAGEKVDDELSRPPEDRSPLT